MLTTPIRLVVVVLLAEVRMPSTNRQLADAEQDRQGGKIVATLPESEQRKSMQMAVMRPNPDFKTAFLKYSDMTMGESNRPGFFYSLHI